MRRPAPLVCEGCAAPGEPVRGMYFGKAAGKAPPYRHKKKIRPGGRRYTVGATPRRRRSLQLSR